MIKDVDMRSCVRVAVGHTATMEVLLQVNIQQLVFVTKRDKIVRELIELTLLGRT